MTKPKHDLTTGSVTRHLVRMTIPMIGGIFAMSALNLTDAYFVSLLGTQALAAISFTFPVIMVIGAIAMGLGMGASAVISNAIGEGNQDRVRRLATDSLLLAFTVVAIFSLVGLLTIDPVFRMLGAGDDIIPLIRSYMTLWYSCMAVVIIPMVGNNCIRATGDTLTPGLIMVVLAVINAILDPIFIFGWFGFPAMGIFGAALATVVSRVIGVVGSLYILTRRCHLITWKIPALSEIWASWKHILHIAAPSALTHLLMPLTMGYITRLVAFFGAPAVAAVGAGGRLLHFAYMIPIAVGSVLLPFIGQNWGSGQRDRAHEAWWKSNRFSLFYGLACVLVFLPLAFPIAGLFSEESEVVRVMVVFVIVLLISSGLQHIAVHSGFALNAIGRPMISLGFNAFRMLFLMCPLAWIGSRVWGLWGLFLGMAISQTVAGLAARFGMPFFLLGKTETEREPSAAATTP